MQYSFVRQYIINANKKLEIDNYKVTKNHSIEYIEHNYARDIQIKEDIKYNTKTNIIKNCKNKYI